MRKRPNARKWPPRRHSFETQGSRNGKESRGTAKKVPEEQEGTEAGQVEAGQVAGNRARVRWSTFNSSGPCRNRVIHKPRSLTTPTEAKRTRRVA